MHWGMNHFKPHVRVEATSLKKLFERFAGLPVLPLLDYIQAHLVFTLTVWLKDPSKTTLYSFWRKSHLSRFGCFSRAIWQVWDIIKRVPPQPCSGRCWRHTIGCLAVGPNILGSASWGSRRDPSRIVWWMWCWLQNMSRITQQICSFESLHPAHEKP